MSWFQLRFPVRFPGRAEKNELPAVAGLTPRTNVRTVNPRMSATPPEAASPPSPAPGGLRPGAAVGFAVLAVALLLFVVLRTARVPGSDQADGAQLLLSTTTLQAGSTFEVRFDADVAAAEELDRPGVREPLEVEPSLRGEWVWLSRRSGVFTPREAMELGTRYTFQLRSGLRAADGKSVTARLRRSFVTPAFEARWQNQRNERETLSARPVVALSFPASVRAAEVAAFAEFRAGARTVAARVHNTHRLQTWLGKFPGDRRARPSSQADDDEPPTLPSLPFFREFEGYVPEAEPSVGRELAAMVTLVPAEPLEPGVEWSLDLRAGLTSPETKRTCTGHTWKLGRVEPFTFASLETHSSLNQGRRIALHFSRPAGFGVETNYATWLTVTPPLKELSCDRYYNGSLWLHGDFALGREYTVVLRAGLPAADGLPLAASVTNRVHFEPLPSAAWFPAFDRAQLARGGRDFQLLALNTPQVRVRAKLLNSHTLIHGLRAYESYIAGARGRERGESFALDWNAVPGRTVFHKTFATEAPTDSTRGVTLPWDEIVGTNRTGTVMLFAEPLENGRLVPGPQSIIQLTDLGVAWKQAGGETLAWVFSHATGRPVTNAVVQLLTEENEALSTARTDERGLARLATPRLPRPNQPEPPLWLLAEAGDDRHALRFNRWDTSVPLYRFRLPAGEAYEGQDAEPVKALLFTDRDAYRPGETLHLKAIARQWRDEGWQFPADKQALLELTDPRGETFLRTNLTLSARGSLDFAQVLPAGPRGDWSLMLRAGVQSFHTSFQVRDFKPNAFEIALEAPRAFAPGEAVRVGVGARYLLGQPLTRAEVSWELVAHDAGFGSEGWGDFRFCSPDYRLEALGFKTGSLTLQGKARLAAGTNLVLTPVIALNQPLPQPRSVRLLTEVTDLNQQTLSRSTDFTVHSSEFYLGLRELGSPQVGKPLPVSLVAVRGDGSAMPAPVQATLRLQRVVWNTVRQLGAGRTIGYRSEPGFTNLVEQPVTTLGVRKVGVKWELAADARPALLPAPDEPGEYLLEARATDAAGRTVLTVMAFDVLPNETPSARRQAWNYRNDVQVELVPDRKTYRVGETATLLVKTPISGAALVSVERDGVRREWVTNLVGNAPAVRVPVLAGDGPNVFVGVLLLRGHADSPRQFPLPEYRVGYCQLQVEQPEHRLEVSVATSTPDVRPGQPVGVRLAVRDHLASAVAGAEVTLYAVDEGVLSLTGYETPDPLKVFQQTRALAVRTDISLPTLLPEDPELRSFQNKGHTIGGGGREDIRRNFQPMAFWSASLLTDARGEVTAQFTAPDSLTRYRVIAVVHAGRAQFGSGTTDFEVNKPLMVEPALPRFAHVGDQLVARAVALNRTETAGEVEVSLQLDGLANAPRLTNRVTVAARAAVPVDFPLAIAEAGTAKWLWRARFVGAGVATFTDTVESTLLVTHPAPLRRAVSYLRVTNNQADLMLGLDPKVLIGRGTATVRLASSQLVGLGECIRQLLHYPYGCVEQTTSSTLPWLVLRDVPDLLPREVRGKLQPDAAIAAGVQRLLSMQTSDGGLSYWPGGREPQVWGSAYGGLGLVLARDAGLPVPERALTRLLDWLRTQLDRSGTVTAGGGLEERCLAVYTLARAGRPAASHHEVLFQRRDWLSPENRALLALAIQQANGPPAMVEELINAKTSARSLPSVWYGCDARERALQLLAWVRHQPAAPVVDRLAADLVRSQREAHWGTTQGNAWALLALVAYADAVEQKTGAATGELVFPGTRQPFALGARSALEQGFTFSPTNLPLLTLANPDRRVLFTQVTVESRSDKLEQASLDRGFLVSRTHERLDDENRPVAGPWRVGDRVLVTLRVAAREPAKWVAIEDPLPAVLEALTPEFKTDQTRGGPAVSSDWWADHKEMRQDRMLFFRNQLPEGAHVIRYLARVRAAGDAIVPSAKVEAMYHPEHMGLSGSVRVKAE